MQLTITSRSQGIETNEYPDVGAELEHVTAMAAVAYKAADDVQTARFKYDDGEVVLNFQQVPNTIKEYDENGFCLTNQPLEVWLESHGVTADEIVQILVFNAMLDIRGIEN